MELETKPRMDLGLGFAIQTDPFQSGREAAQMAKSQLRSQNSNLVLAIGPSHLHFKDFIEGVRLVTGEEGLIGIPTDRVVSNELFSPHTCVVIIIRSETTRFSFSSTTIDEENPLPSLTNIFSQLRQSRGNIRNQYDEYGLILISNHQTASPQIFPKLVLSETGPEARLLQTTPAQTDPSPLICHDKIIKNGVVALECLSTKPWGTGVVGIGAFKNHPNVFRDAVKTALRDAYSQISKSRAVLGFLLFNFETDGLTPDDFGSIFKASQEIISDLPLVGMASKDLFIRCLDGPDIVTHDSIVAILIPDS